MIFFHINLHSCENNFVKISQSDLDSKKLLNEKLINTAKFGFFYLEIPDDCKEFIDLAKKFANSFYKDEFIKEF